MVDIHPRREAVGGEDEIASLLDIQRLLVPSSLGLGAQCPLAGWNVFFCLVAAKANPANMLPGCPTEHSNALLMWMTG